ncbi:MAG: hypothetical protein IJX47_02400 [Clostridia bacterium]|nr:hypothetical protein [Clostridia bacterium]
MTGEEAKVAALKELPVVWSNPIHGSIEYDRIVRIEYTPKDGRFIVGLALLDRNRHSVTVAPMEEVELIVLQVEKEPGVRYTAKGKG